MIKVLKASAGAGKTYKLVLEYIKALMKAEEGFLRNDRGWVMNPHRQILAITFTNNSTNEMKERILKELYRLWKGENKDYEEAITKAFNNLENSENRIRETARRLLDNILNDYTMMRVSTIDSFFNQIIRSFTRDLGLDQTPIAEIDDAHIREKAVDTLLAELDGENNKELLKFIKEFASSEISEGKKWKIRDKMIEFSTVILSEDYISHFDGDKTTIEQIANYKKNLSEYIHQHQAIANETLDKMVEIAIANQNGMNANVFKAITNRNMGSATWTKENDKVIFFNKGKGDAATDEMLRKLHAKVQESIFSQEYNTKAFILKSIHITGVLGELRKTTDIICRENDCILLSTANHLITKIIDGCDTPFIYERIGVSTNHYMIDEFQDTSHIQWENFLPLISEANSQGNDSLIVGDIKQSIYRWRNGDWKILHKAIDEKFGKAVINDPLNYNYRSSHIVVKFNNMLYTKLPELMDERLGTHIFKDIYSNGEQLMPEKNKEKSGKIETHFISKDAKSSEFIQYASKFIANKIKENNHTHCGTTAVIVRKNAEAEQIADTLAETGIPFCSSESSLLNTNITVRLIIAYLKHIIAPEELLYQHELKHLTESLGIGLISEEPSRLPLQDIPAAIMDEVGLKPNPFVYALTDTIKRYVMNNGASIPRFIEWWEKHEEKLCIPMPKLADTVTIMTIHKSKGLEFDNVYLLMAKEPWKCGIDGKHTNYKTVTTDQIPHVILNINSSDMKKTSYANINKTEEIDCCVDTLNTLYVATTRAVENLFIIAHDGGEDNLSMTNLLMKAVDGEAEEIEEIEDIENPNVLNNIDVSNNTEKTNIKKPFSFANISQESKEQRHGTICHQFLSFIEKEGDEVQAIEKMLTGGTITGNDINELMTVYNRLKEKGLFNPAYKSFNERSIAINGEIYRPDRIIFTGEKSVKVVDYKFGEKRPEHQKQIEKYAALLRAMGYSVEWEILYN